jgi:hypothetical protein
MHTTDDNEIIGDNLVIKKMKNVLMKGFSKIKKCINKKMKSSNEEQEDENAFVKELTGVLQFKMLVSNTIFILPNTNAIYINYSMFSTFAIPSKYDVMVFHFFNLINEVLKEFSTYQLHINLKTFTITAIEKYHNLIFLIYKKGFYDAYINYIEAICVYHCPSVFETLKNVFITIFNIKEYTMEPMLYSKKESDELIHQLLQTCGNSGAGATPP